MIQSSEVPRSAKPKHWDTASRCRTNSKHLGLVAQTGSKAWWVDVLHQGFDSVGSLQTDHFRSAIRDTVKLIDPTQAAAL